MLQTTLNCELLNHELGLELRWTLSDDDIILQLVANTGSDRYLALGIREISGLKAVSGDVLVGWISSKSGKGGIDDYFLAGDAIQCDDGAENKVEFGLPHMLTMMMMMMRMMMTGMMMTMMVRIRMITTNL